MGARLWRIFGIKKLLRNNKISWLSGFAFLKSKSLTILRLGFTSLR
jgi:hypothetical protein